MVAAQAGGCSSGGAARAQVHRARRRGAVPSAVAFEQAVVRPSARTLDLQLRAAEAQLEGCSASNAPAGVGANAGSPLRMRRPAKPATTPSQAPAMAAVCTPWWVLPWWSSRSARTPRAK